jgi:phosphocarrier protein FPr
MKQKAFKIQNPTGLHARPAKVFVNLAKAYQSDIRVFYGEKKANAKSLISMLTLGVERGSEIRVEVEGQDEAEALQAIEAAVHGGLGDEMPSEGDVISDEPEVKTEPERPAAGQAVAADDHHIQGIAGAPGIAIGPVYHLKQTEIKVEATFDNESEEKNQLQAAVETAKGQLRHLKEEMLASNARSEAAIFDVHLELLDDVELLDDIVEKINRKQSAALAWQSTIDARAKLVASLDDPLLAARAADLRDVGYRVLRILIGAEETVAEFPDHPVIVFAEDLSPSDTASLDREKVLGFCTAGGGPTAHTAIIARALGLPAVVSAGERVLKLEESTPVILNGNTGMLTLSPSETEIAAAIEAQQEAQSRQQQDRAQAAEPATTLDGHTVEIAANIGGVEDAKLAVKNGAEAVGLLRTEFLFLERETPPSENEQFGVYRDIGLAMGERAVVVRTLDVGGDKPLPYYPMEKELNPFLGERGIRLCLNRPELLEEQIRAILRATQSGRFRIMFPMVADLSEWQAAREMVKKVAAELGAVAVELGIMVEIPSAALMADVFAEQVDFFSIGTNDLTQYTLAMDRLHPHLAGKSDGLHPAVLRLIDRTVQAAHRAGKWVGVCGELGADPQAVPILVGLGVDELSVTAPAVPTVKAQVRGLDFARSQALAQDALKCKTAKEVRQLTAS